MDSTDNEQQVQEHMPFRVILASASPRRRELLAEAGVSFSVYATNVDETLDDDLRANPPEAAKKLAERKAAGVVQVLLADPQTDGVFFIIGADTMVVKDGEIFGKPRNRDDALRMLGILQNATHDVHTAVSVWALQANANDPEGISLGFRTFCDTAHVAFKPLSPADIDAYVRCGESFDKAGAYAAQGEGAKLIERIDGCRSCVIGLPVERLRREFPEIFSCRSAS